MFAHNNKPQLKGSRMSHRRHLKVASACGVGLLLWVVCSLTTRAQEDSSAAAEASGIAQSGYRLRAEPFEEWTTIDDGVPVEMAGVWSGAPRGKFVIPANISEGALESYRALADLPPIESYFFGLPETVCFPDERKQVHATTQTPFSANCQLVITLPGDGASKAVGTGWLLGPRLVVTAGHCVHEGAGGNFFPAVEVIPGMNGPLRPFDSQVSGELRASQGWKIHGSVAQDYGAILLQNDFRAADGSAPGNHEIAILGDAELNNLPIYLAGYPADKEFGSQWTDDDPVTSIQSARLRYMIDTYGGHSGSAVIPMGRKEVVGIHNYGGCPNHCTRITAEVKTDLDKWLAESDQ
jgi:glutamyl endopeptidase